jgi:HAD superfamily hydrolase (TIGR01549 family)
MKIRCVIFDMDGTLTQTNQLIFDSFNYIAQKYAGKRFTDKEITAMFGPPEEDALIPMVGKERIDAVLQDYLGYYREHHSLLAKLYPGIPELLGFLRQQGCKIALFTGKGVHTTMITLDEFKLRSNFDLVVTGNDVVNHKPSAEGIQKILKHFSLKPGEVLMVGDAVSDVLASKEAGVPIAAVLWDSYGRENVLKMQTDYMFHNVPEFIEWIRAQFNEHETDG